jgi:hypothetical protein
MLSFLDESIIKINNTLLHAAIVCGRPEPSTCLSVAICSQGPKDQEMRLAWKMMLFILITLVHIQPSHPTCPPVPLALSFGRLSNQIQWVAIFTNEPYVPALAQDAMVCFSHQ